MCIQKSQSSGKFSEQSEISANYEPHFEDVQYTGKVTKSPQNSPNIAKLQKADSAENLVTLPDSSTNLGLDDAAIKSLEDRWSRNTRSKQKIKTILIARYD